MAPELAAFYSRSLFKILFTAPFTKRLNLNKAKSMENIALPVVDLSKLSESPSTKAQLILTAETTQPIPSSIENSVNITGSTVCQECESLLERMDSYAARITQQGTDYQSYGNIRLGAIFDKAAKCHLCALLLSLFNKDELATLNNEDLEMLGDFYHGQLSAIRVRDKFLRCTQWSDLNSVFSAY